MIEQSVFSVPLYVKQNNFEICTPKSADTEFVAHHSAPYDSTAMFCIPIGLSIVVSCCLFCCCSPLSASIFLNAVELILFPVDSSGTSSTTSICKKGKDVDLSLNSDQLVTA